MFKKKRLVDDLPGVTSIIGANTKFNGELSGNGHLVVSGNVDSNGSFDGAVTITSEGSWTGTIEADDVIIAGTVDGKIKCRGRVEVQASGRVKGIVSGQKIAIAEGAVIDGELHTENGGDVLHFSEKRKVTIE